MANIHEATESRFATRSPQLLHERKRQPNERQVHLAAATSLLHANPRARLTKRHRVLEGLVLDQAIPGQEEPHNQSGHIHQKVIQT